MRHLKRFNESNTYYKDLVIDIFREVADEYLVELSVDQHEEDYIDANGLYYYCDTEYIGDFDLKLVIFYNFGYSDEGVDMSDSWKLIKYDMEEKIIPRLEKIGYKLNVAQCEEDKWSSFVISIHFP